MTRSNYRWYILALTMLTYGIIGGAARLCMPVLFKEISDDLNLSIVSIGTIWGMDPLAGIFVGLLGGLLADRFGIKWTLTVICVLAAGFSALRGLSNSFGTLAATMFLFGMMAAMTPSIVPKTAAVWFEKRQLGFINALINIPWSVGAMAATMTSATILSPWLGGWRNVLFFWSVPAVIIGILWLVTGRDPQKADRPADRLEAPAGAAEEPARVPLREAFFRVIRIKEVWVLGVTALALWGANTGFIGYLPLYLRNIGWSPARADGVITAFNGASMVGTIPMVMLATRLGNYRGMLFFSLALTAAFMILTPLVGDVGIWPLVIIATFLRSSAFAVTNVLLFNMKQIGSTYVGTAVGLVTSIGMLGAFAAPPLGNSFTAFADYAPFFFWGGLAALSLPFFLFLRRSN